MGLDIAVMNALSGDKQRNKGKVVDLQDAWKNQLEVNETGDYKRNAHNILTIFRNDPKLSNFVYDLFSGAACVIGKLPWDASSERRIWEDTDDACLRNYFDINYGIRSKDLLYDALTERLKQVETHPVKDYLNGLKWDGTPRVERILIDFLGAEDTECNRIYAKKTFIAGVRRIFEPGCKHDTILTLVGPKGLGKSSVFGHMGKDWFLDSLKKVDDKDAMQSLQGSWIIEMGELAVLRKSELEAFKSYVTSRVDKFRPSYGRRQVERPRQCLFVATTNDDHFIKDQSGERRFWPVRVTRKMTPEESELFKSIVDQLWAESKHYYEKGETTFLNPKQEKDFGKLAEEFIDADPRKGMIEEFLEVKLPVNWRTRKLSEKQEYFRDEEYTGGSQIRTRISAMEIHCECYLETIGKFTSAKGREINAILKTMDTWNYIGRQRCGEYGNQGTFERTTEVVEEWPDL